MRTESNAKKNSPVGLVEECSSSAPWRVMSVETIPEEYRLRVKFSDGTTGIVDMTRLVHSPEAGVFAVLQDLALFGQVGLEYGTVTWPDELDLAPDAMYDAIREHGVWSL
jgi:CubicO group peptidase (beta-lactamase class C family)